MVDINVDINKLKILLKFDGVEFDFSDEELRLLVDYKLLELESLLGVKIQQSEEIKIIHKFKGKLLELNFYPVLTLEEICVNGRQLLSSEYDVNYELGIIYFNNYIVGDVRVKYVIGFDESRFEYLIFPLLKDMLGYTIRYGKINSIYGGITGIASSLKEGDVSVNFASNNLNGVGSYGYDGGINNRIEELRKRFTYSARVRLL